VALVSVVVSVGERPPGVASVGVGLNRDGIGLGRCRARLRQPEARPATLLDFGRTVAQRDQVQDGRRHSVKQLQRVSSASSAASTGRVSGCSRAELQPA
jgi:hypothetical protein